MIKREDVLGQDTVLDKFDKMIEEHTLPHCLVIMGSYGSGRKYMAKYITDKLDATIYQSDEDKNTVAYARKVIEQAYTQTEPIVYLFNNMDYLKVEVANALLKITEEPPENAYFIITCTLIMDIPKTLRSRCFSIRLKHYDYNTLAEIALRNGCKPENIGKVLQDCETPGLVINRLKTMQTVQELEEYVDKVVDNIGKVSTSNVFKIDEKIAFKVDDTGFNLNAFWIAFSNNCMQRTKEIHNSKRNMYFRWIRITGEYREKLLINGINKRILFDTWLVEIRDSYSKYN